MNSPRNEFQMVLLTDGTVLAAGGFGGAGNLASSEVYNRITKTWTLTGNMNVARNFPQMALLPDGTVLVSGGFSNTATQASSEVYNPATSTWVLTKGGMNSARAFFQMVLLQS
ncbi:g905 [Coccomyxa viridis]|uniref:G905 protein n=1 Tax=Coccomyxa viridis TaxID=1274662 RepID=A0ABP1FGS7_9CHLO